MIQKLLHWLFPKKEFKPRFYNNSHWNSLKLINNLNKQ